MVNSWRGKRSKKTTLKMRLDPAAVAEFDRLAELTGNTRVGAFRLLQQLARHGFTAGVVREVNGRCSVIQLSAAKLRKLGAYLPAGVARELSEIDRAARDISALVVPRDENDQAGAVGGGGAAIGDRMIG